MAAQTETYEPKLSHSFFNLPGSQDLAVIGRLGWLVGTRGPAAKKQPSTAPRPTEKPERARTPVNGFVSSEHATFAGVFTLNGWFGPFNRRACSLSFFSAQKRALDEKFALYEHPVCEGALCARSST